MDFIDELSNSDLINLIGASGNWISAIVSFFAVLVALYLARRSERVKLKATVGNRVIVSGLHSTITKCLMISVTNVGSRTVYVKSFSISIGRLWKKSSAIVKDTEGVRKIEYGETTALIISYEQYPNWQRELIQDLVKDESLNTLYFSINTSVGYVKSVKPEKAFLKGIKRLQINQQQQREEAQNEVLSGDSSSHTDGN